MRLVERFSIIVFSIIVLIMSGFTILVSTNLINIDVFEDIFDVLSGNIIATICVCIVFALWAIANIFFKSDSGNENSNGVLLENENGSLLITKESISNLVESVLKKNAEVKEESVRIEFNQNRDVIVNLIISVRDNAVIKDTSAKLQENIKLLIKKATDLDVKEINIKIKSVEQEKKVQSVQ